MEFCVGCDKDDVPLFRERNNGKVFCGSECQGAYYASSSINRSIWLDDFKKGNAVPPELLWNLIVKSGMTIRQIVEDFFNYYNLSKQESKDHTNLVKEMLLWIFNNPQFTTNTWGISLGQFMAHFSQMVIKIDSVDFLYFFIEKLHFNPAMNNNYPIRRASELGSVNIVRALLQDNRVDPSVDNNTAIINASRNGRTEVVRVLLQDKRVDPSTYLMSALIWASRNGHVDVVRVLLQDKRVDPSENGNLSIIWASENGRTDVVRVLLQDRRTDPSAMNNSAIYSASRNGHTEVVRVLLQDRRVDRRGEFSSRIFEGAIERASENGHAEVVRVLLQDRRVDPSVDDNETILHASRNGHTEVVIILLQDKRVLAAMTREMFDSLEENSNPVLKKYIDAARVSWTRLKALKGTSQGAGEGPTKRLKEKINLVSL